MSKFYEIVFSTKKCEKSFLQLPGHIKADYEKWEIELAKDPENACSGTLTHNLFDGYKKPIYKKRFGDYRVVYAISNVTGSEGPGFVVIIRIGHRSDIYSGN